MSSMRPASAPASTALRVLLVLASSAALALPLQQRLVDGLLPAWRVAIEHLEPDFKVTDLRSSSGPPRPSIDLTVTPARYMIVGARAIAPDAAAQARSSTPRGAVWLVVTVFATGLAVWPLRFGAREMAWRLLAGLPLLAALLLVDVPLALVGPLRAMLVETLDPHGWHPWVTASAFMRGGGRVMLSLLAASAVCLCVQVAMRRPATPRDGARQ